MATLARELFGCTKDGQDITKYTITTSKGSSVSIINYGAIIQALSVPDKDGKMGDITLGFDNIQDYESKNKPYFGAVCGRVANLINNAEFELDGETYTLYANRPPHTVHGGKEGFNMKVWSASPQDDQSLTLTYVSADGEEGYPGECTVTVNYAFSDDDKLTLTYSASTTRPTLVNLTNHAYFNLAGHGHASLDGHQYTVFSDTCLEMDDQYIATGGILDVQGTPCDFTKPTQITTSGLKALNEGLGYMNTWPLNNGGQFRKASRMEHPPSGRFVECTTSEPSVCFYTSGYMPDLTGKGGASYKQFCAFSMEAQHYPDSCHHDNFPTTVLRPGETFKSTTMYNFGRM